MYKCKFNADDKIISLSLSLCRSVRQMGNAGTIWRCRNQSVAQLFNHVWNVSGPGAWCASWKIYVGVNLCVLCTIECMRGFVAISLSEASALCVFIAIELSTWCSWQKCIELNVIHRKFGIVCAARSQRPNTESTHTSNERLPLNG